MSDVSPSSVNTLSSAHQLQCRQARRPRLAWAAPAAAGRSTAPALWVLVDRLDPHVREQVATGRDVADDRKQKAHAHRRARRRAARGQQQRMRVRAARDEERLVPVHDPRAAGELPALAAPDSKSPPGRSVYGRGSSHCRNGCTGSWPQPSNDPSPARAGDVLAAASATNAPAITSNCRMLLTVPADPIVSPSPLCAAVLAVSSRRRRPTIPRRGEGTARSPNPSFE